MTQLFEDAVSEPAVQETAPQNPATTEQLRLERVMATATAEKASLREKLKEAFSKGNEVKAELTKVEAAIRSAEDRSRLIGSSRGDYINARSEQLARGLLGEKVELSEVQRSADFADNLTASDLAEGLRILKRKRDDLVLGLNIVKGEAKSISSDFYKQHAILNGARYELLRGQICSAFIEIQAAHRLNLSFDPMHPILWDNATEMVLPTLTAQEAMAPVRKFPHLSSYDITGLSLTRSALVDNASNKINAELEGK